MTSDSIFDHCSIFVPNEAGLHVYITKIELCGVSEVLRVLCRKTFNERFDLSCPADVGRQDPWQGNNG